MLRIRTILLGASCCGKTQIVNNLRSNRLINSYVPTIGVDFFTYTTEDVQFKIWDCSGAYAFAQVVHTFYRNQNLVILVYRSQKDFERVAEYIQDVKKNVETTAEIRFVVFSIGKNPEYIKDLREDVYSFHFNALDIEQTKNTFHKLALLCKLEYRRGWFTSKVVVDLGVDEERSNTECLKFPCI